MRREHLGLVVAMFVLAGVVGAVMWFKWNSDGPGTHGGGEDLAVKIEAPMAAPLQPPESPPESRRRERATIAGAVRDPGGRPIAGAMVCATASSTLLGASDTRWPSCASTGPDGSYRLSDLFGVRQRVSASAAGYLPGEQVHLHAGVRRRAIDLRPGGAGQDIDVTLERGGVEIRGVVRDLRGEAIADAWVASGEPEDGSPRAWGRSGVDGQFVLWVRPGVVTVVAQATGHVAGSARGASEAHTFAVYLAPASLLRGKVLGVDREPVEGAWVRAQRGGELTQTDAAGHFEFAALAPGVYKPEVETDDGFGMAAEQVSLGLGEPSPLLTISLQAAVFVEGHIVRAGGELCDDGSLRLRDLATGREVYDRSEASGLVHLRGLLPGTYTVTIACKGAIAAERYPLLTVGERDILDQVWEVANGRSITGVVVDASGVAVPGVRLVARAAGTTSEPPAAVSDEAGRFRLRGLLAGKYAIVPVAQAQRTMPDAAVAVEIGAAEPPGLRVALAATGALRGKLRDPKARPIAGAELSLRTAWGEQRAVTGDDGGFHFPTAAVGSSTLGASLGGAPLALSRRSRVSIRGGRTATIELVSAAATGVITGVLRDADGRSIAGALVEARAETGGPVGAAGLLRNDTRAPQLTDVAGRFALAGLPAASYTVVARRIGGGEARRQHVRPGAAMTLALAPCGRVTGTVVLPGGGVPGAFVIEMVEVGTGRRRGDEFVGTAGAWALGGLPHGSYELRVQAREGALTQALEFTAGQERSGLRLELVGATTLRGTVLDLEGRPVPELEVASASVRGIASDTRIITDESGRFELSRVPVGLVWVTVGTPGARPGPYGTTRVGVEVPPDRRTIDVPPIRVARRRIGDGEGRGDLGFTLVGGKPGVDAQLAPLKVATVRHGGPAAAAGLQVRDEIVAVDGEDVRGAKRSLYNTLVEVPAGVSLRLELARGVTLELVTSRKR